MRARRRWTGPPLAVATVVSIDGSVNKKAPRDYGIEFIGPLPD
jgi:hypothetical protein